MIFAILVDKTAYFAETGMADSNGLIIFSDDRIAERFTDMFAEKADSGLSKVITVREGMTDIIRVSDISNQTEIEFFNFGFKGQEVFEGAESDVFTEETNVIRGNDGG